MEQFLAPSSADTSSAPGRDSASTNDIAELVSAATAGDQQAWRALHDIFTPLIFRVAINLRLTRSDAADVSQTVWLQLVQHLQNIREPRALPGWIVTTTQRTAFRMIRKGRGLVAVDPTTDDRLSRSDHSGVGDEIERREQIELVSAVVENLRPHDRELIRLLFGDDRVSYSEISHRLGIPIGSIGPTRARCLNRLKAMLMVTSLDATNVA